MFVKVARDYTSMSERAARIVADLVREKPTAVLGLATGSTPVGLYAALVRIAHEEQIDFSGVTTFNLDEYEGLPAAHPQSYRYFMQQHLFEELGLTESQTHVLDGVASDLAAECSQFEERIRAAGGIDLQVLGIGGDGHIAFCEPGSSFGGRTSVVALHPKTIEDNSRFFDSEAQVPRRALTMGIGAITEARVCLVLAKGRQKSDVWAKMIEGPITSQIPATALQLHPCGHRHFRRRGCETTSESRLLSTCRPGDCRPARLAAVGIRRTTRPAPAGIRLELMGGYGGS